MRVDLDHSGDELRRRAELIVLRFVIGRLTENARASTASSRFSAPTSATNRPEGDEFLCLDALSLICRWPNASRLHLNQSVERPRLGALRSGVARNAWGIWGTSRPTPFVIQDGLGLSNYSRRIWHRHLGDILVGAQPNLGRFRSLFRAVHVRACFRSPRHARCHQQNLQRYSPERNRCSATLFAGCRSSSRSASGNGRARTNFDKLCGASKPHDPHGVEAVCAALKRL